MNRDEHWQTAPLDTLIDHILGHHHALLHRELPLIGELLNAHVRDYWVKHPELLKAHSLFAELRALLDQHLIMEEATGFPLVAAHLRDERVSMAPFVDTLDGHVDQHTQVGKLLAALRGALWNFEAPPDIRAEVGWTCKCLQQIEDDLAVHVHLENDILFPRVRKAG